MDAIVGEDHFAFAMVAKDEKKKLLHLKYVIHPSFSLFMAELKALLWASNVIKLWGWNIVDWSFDVQMVVNEVLDPEEPCNWESRHDVLYLRNCFGPSNFTWNLSWTG